MQQGAPADAVYIIAEGEAEVSVFGLDGEGLSRALDNATLFANGFVNLKTTMRDGYIELSGRFQANGTRARMYQASRVTEWKPQFSKGSGIISGMTERCGIVCHGTIAVAFIADLT